jgi:hypothetical protein
VHKFGLFAPMPVLTIPMSIPLESQTRMIGSSCCLKNPTKLPIPFEKRFKMPSKKCGILIIDSHGRAWRKGTVGSQLASLAFQLWKICKENLIIRI